MDVIGFARSDGPAWPPGEALAADPPLPVLEPALWRDLAAAEDLPSFSASWLALECRLIAHVAGGVVHAVAGSGPALVAAFPQDFAGEALDSVVGLAVAEQRGVVRLGQTLPENPGMHATELALRQLDV